MKTIIKTAFAFFLFAATSSCTKENMKATQSVSLSAASGANDVAAHRIGETFGGGIIFYLNATKDHGLIAATKDQSSAMKWYKKNYVVTGATRTAIGTGLTNTNKIISKQGNSGNYAAKLCADLVSGGFSDWYLPSKQELNQLYKHKDKVPGLEASNYWSSTESDINNAFDQEFGGGFQFADDKSFTIHVRAIRSF